IALELEGLEGQPRDLGGECRLFRGVDQIGLVAEAFGERRLRRRLGVREQAGLAGHGREIGSRPHAGNRVFGNDGLRYFCADDLATATRPGVDQQSVWGTAMQDLLQRALVMLLAAAVLSAAPGRAEANYLDDNAKFAKAISE